MMFLEKIVLLKENKMSEKSRDRVLWELEHFGIPTRVRSLAEAQKLVQSGQLTRKQVDDACTKYQSRIEAKNVRKYGTPNPTDEQKMSYALNFIDECKGKLKGISASPNFVKMNDGKYSSGEEIYTSRLGGCIVTLLYFEGKETKEGILTHYPPLDIDDNIAKLRELQEKNLRGDYQRQRGIVLVERPTEASQLLETGIKAIFPEATLETVVYDQTKVGKVSLDPSQSEWKTEQHGRNLV